MDNFDGTMFYHAILARIQGDIESAARNLYLKNCMHLSISMDDLTQEGMIGAWQACTRYDESKIKTESSIDGYCMQRAKGAMLDFLRKHRVRYDGERSLEAHLEVKTEKKTIYNDIEDKPIMRTETPDHVREALLKAIGRITPRQRVVVMAAFQIEDETGNITTRDETGLSANQYDSAKMNALMRLRTLLKSEDLVLA